MVLQYWSSAICCAPVHINIWSGTFGVNSCCVVFFHSEAKFLCKATYIDLTKWTSAVKSTNEWFPQLLYMDVQISLYKKEVKMWPTQILDYQKVHFFDSLSLHAWNSFGYNKAISIMLWSLGRIRFATKAILFFLRFCNFTDSLSCKSMTLHPGKIL